MDQQNSGEHQRIAGRDYNESTVVTSLRLYVTTRSSEKLDAESLDNERLFRYRFGIDVGREARSDVLQIKAAGRYTDRQIRWLIRSGQLKSNQTGSKLRNRSLMMLIAGVFFSAVAALFFASIIAQIHYSKHASDLLRLAGIAIALWCWYASTRFFWNLFMGPWFWTRPAA